MNSRPDFAAELKHSWNDARIVVSVLGLVDGCKRVAGGYMVRCPWHAERTPSCSIQSKQGIIQAHCFACDAKGSVLDLVAAVEGLDVGQDFPTVVRRTAELAQRWDIVDALDGKSDPRPRPPQLKPSPEPEPERTYPPIAEVLSLWGECRPTAGDAEVSAWLRSRGLDADAVDVRDLARALPNAAILPRWARREGHNWSQSKHRIIVPFFDAQGELRTLRASRVVADTPKRLGPAGHKASGVVMADAIALEVIRLGARPAWLDEPLRVVIAEGEPDWLTWATRFPLDAPAPYASLGIINGSWSDELAARIPNGSRIIIRTDHDAAGDKYAAEVTKTLAHRCTVLRSKETP